MLAYQAQVDTVGVRTVTLMFCMQLLKVAMVVACAFGPACRASKVKAKAEIERAKSAAGFIVKEIPPEVLRFLGWTRKNAGYRLGRVKRNKDLFELFSGSGGLSDAFENDGGRVTRFDMKNDPVQQNLCTVEGMALALMTVLSVVAGGLVWVGFPCTTMVWMARSAMRRTKAFPEGNCMRADVRDANFMAWYCAKLLYICHLRGVRYIIEQPATSVLWRLRPMVWLEEETYAGRVFGDLGVWGHSMTKPSVFKGTAWYMHKLGKTLTKIQKQAKDKKHVNSIRPNGKKQVRGKKDLKASEHYPKNMCKLISAAAMKRPMQEDALMVPSKKQKIGARGVKSK